MAQGVRLSGISKAYAGNTVLNEVSLDIQQGEFLSLVGASGCGKSTLLRIIAGLEEADHGTVRIGDRDVSHLDPQQRDVAMVFQSYALYPHMTVGENIATPLRMSRLTPLARWPLIGPLAPGRRRALAEIDRDVQAVATQLQIQPLLDRKPAQLSGGQRQRVALARAIVRQPAAFLMDEPLSNLDAKLRVHMRTELTELHRRLGATFIYVTHDQVEAMTMSDRIALMADGDILQVGTPSELYGRPATLRVAQFIGSPSINCFEADVIDGVPHLTGEPLSGLRVEGHRTLTVAIRPEALRLTAEPGDVALHAIVRRLEHHGADGFLIAAPADRPERTLHVRLSMAEADGVAAGQRIGLYFRPAQAHLFAEDGSRIEPQPDEAAARAAMRQRAGVSA